ncbi:DUF805 domain-containing protein [Robertkochia aurantiaca]|uniref:DUF805 domain-containing protein n=1 Tax=Robertkochia aurantiaca TaxID=2873700 RepID=UPI001CCCC760|nr:DUF805 domain-containing protein [Robertkochia sp. 3YJGBD-33]
MFKNPFSFNGRIRRTEYGLSYLIYCFAYFLFIGIVDSPNQTSSLIGLIILIPSLWFIIAQGAKRCHDRGNSGWYQIIPFYGLWMLFASGDSGDNMYGPNPKI